MKNLISVIMSVYKEPVGDVARSVESIILQTYDNWELIIVLDCPQNLQVENYVAHLSLQYRNISYIKNEANIGLGASLNKAIENVRGEYCARMDAEDYSFAKRFEKQIAYFNKNPGVDLLFTQWQEINSHGLITKKEPKSVDVKNIKKNFFIKSILLHPTLLIRSKILKKHFYPEMARPEDWVLFLSLIRQGFKFDLVEEILYEYVVDNHHKFQKVRNYSSNLLPHLLRNIPNYFMNLYYWIYCIRIIGEFLISRNEYIYAKTSRLSALIWKKIFRSA